MKHFISACKSAGAALAVFCSSCVDSGPPASPAPSQRDATDQTRQEIFQTDLADVDFILKQIEIAEAHAAGAPLDTIVPSPLLPYGLRTVDGTFNNLLPGQEAFGSSDRIFPRLTPPVFRGAADGTSYAQVAGNVTDPQPRIISNLIVDQTDANPAVIAAAEQNEFAPAADVNGLFFLPNIAPDEGLSAPFNTWFAFFGQFFDHGLDLVAKGGSGTVIMPLETDDPLFVAGSPTNFMPLTRATNRAGTDGFLGTADDVHEHLNHTTAFVDQNQTFTSHPSHQVFLREYFLDPATGHPLATGRLLDGDTTGGLVNWAEVKQQALEKLGILLEDPDVLRIPLIDTDPYGRFIPGPNGFPRLVIAPGVFAEGDPSSPAIAGLALSTGHTFVEDIAHAAVPGPGYDAALLDAHFCTGDGRGNENIGLTSVHFIFHAEHNRLVEHVKQVVLSSGNPTWIARWLRSGADPNAIGENDWNGERIFQAARFGTEMVYQHLVFEEFARKVQPEVNVFGTYDASLDATMMAEFAHTVYRFGHSMLRETVPRTNEVGETSEIPLIQAFLNPQLFTAGFATQADAAAAVIRGTTRQVGNEIDEFVTDGVRNNLLGLPLDLPSINIARARDTGVPPLNEARRIFFAATGNSALRPYSSWADYELGMRHPESLVNFVAAYGTHPTILAATNNADRRAAAEALYLSGPGTDGADFIEGAGTWAGVETGLNDVDFWVGGLAEKQMIFGGLLGSTFNFVFETQLEKLQEGDRLYYLARTEGLNFLTQLEENSFTELVMRNTSVKNLPADIFSRPTFVFDLTAFTDPGSVIPDDPATPEDESGDLIRMPDGTIRYIGVEHVVMGGTPDADRMRGSEGDDTIWGYEGDDWIEGDDGNDQLMGGDGDDIITDIFGIDVIKGGDGHDAINGGQGLGDLLIGGAGQDFINAGQDASEVFAGMGNDFVIAGDDADTVFGGEGDDWIEGGTGNDLLQGDNGEPFQISPILGHDVIIGQGGDDDYDSESGDDIMVSDFGIERHEGMLGFDWVTYKGSPFPADADLSRTALLPPDVDNIRDRFDEVEGLSGWDHDDILIGDDETTVELAAIEEVSGQNNALNDSTQIQRIAGLQGLLGAGVTSFSAGNIILGGNGSDVIEGRGGDDLLDGDAWLNVRISVRDSKDPTVPGNEIATTDGMTRLLLNKSGPLAGQPDTLTLQAAIFAGIINPGQLRIVREILVTPGPDAASDIDTAVFSEALANYDISVDAADGTITVVHARGAQTDGTDTLRNIEMLQFADQLIPVTGIPPIDTVPPAAVSAFTAIAGDTQVELAWTNPVDATAVRILRSTTAPAAAPTDTVGQTVVFNAAGSTFTDTGLVNGTEYFYAAFARDAAGNYGPRAVASATPAAPVVGLVDPVTAFDAVAGNAQVALSWTNPAGAVGVRILRSTVGVAASPTALADQTVIFDGAGTAFTNTGLTNGTQYFYTAFARNAGGTFSAGASDAAVPTAPVIDPPPPGCGCATAGADPFAALLGVAMLGGIVRRKRR